MKIITYIAAIEHQSGMDLFTAGSEDALGAKVAEYCRSHWETLASSGNPVRTAIPETEAAVIELYFADHEDDRLTTGCDSAEIDLHLVVESFNLQPTVSLYHSAEDARASALDIAMENFWDPDTDEAAARAKFELELDEDGSVRYGDHVVHLLPAAEYRALQERVSRSSAAPSC